MTGHQIAAVLTGDQIADALTALGDLANGRDTVDDFTSNQHAVMMHVGALRRQDRP